jgi:hypothetical protein
VRQVLILGADFTPSSLPPALRIRFFAHHLAEFGWQPTVLTTDYRYYEHPVDFENEKLLPGTYRIIRTSAFSAGLTRVFGLGDLGLRSLWYHWLALKQLCKDNRFDLLVIPVPPYPTMLLGRLAHARFGLPYLIDYIDPWITKRYWKSPPEQRPPKWFLASILAEVLEPVSLRRVSHITGVSAGTTASVLSRYPWLEGISASEIPYGGEPEDFEYLRRHPRLNPIFRPDDGLLHLSYVGACIPQMQATVRALFEAFRRGLQLEPSLFKRARLHFVGTTYAPQAEGRFQVLPLVREAGLDEYVDEHPARLPYLEAMQTQLDSHALLLVGSDAPHYTASKVFPGVLSRRPVLAIFHEASSVVSILQETRAGRVVTYDSEHPPDSRVPEIMQQLSEMLSLQPDHEPATDWMVFERYTTRSMARKLAEASDCALRRSGAA